MKKLSLMILTIFMLFGFQMKPLQVFAVPSGFDVVDKTDDEDNDEDVDEDTGDDGQDDEGGGFVQPTLSEQIKPIMPSDTSETDFYNLQSKNLRYNAGWRTNEDGEMYIDYEYLGEAHDYFVNQGVRNAEELLNQMRTSNPTTFVRGLYFDSRMQDVVKEIFSFFGQEPTDENDEELEEAFDFFEEEE